MAGMAINLTFCDMKRLLLILFLALLPGLSMMARETIKGTVVDAHGDPIPGVRVEVIGQDNFTFTDFDGMYQLILREPAKNLKFTYPGYSPSTYRIKPEMTVVLGKGWAGHETGARALLDLEGGMGFNGKATFKSGYMEAKDVHTFLLTGMMITPGYQFNRHLFVGLGTGAYLEIEKYLQYSHYEFRFIGINVPLFITARWDFGLTKKTAPYVDFRIGYNRFIGTDEASETCRISNWNGNSYNLLIVGQKDTGSFFFAPSIGYRVSIHKKFGMNFGLRYMTGLKKTYKATIGFSDGNSYTESTQEFSQRGSDMLFFNIGFDF